MIIDIYKAKKNHKQVWVAILADGVITDVSLPDDIQICSSPFKTSVDTTQAGVIGLPVNIDKEINNSGYSIFLT